MRLPRASGILLHPTSLPGPHGAGDLGAAAFHFIDWLAAAGQTLWQVLPLGGIGPGNSPYMSSSAFAGNVLLIDLAELAARGWLSDADLDTGGLFDAHGQRIDYAAMVPWRMERLERAARAFARTAPASLSAPAADAEYLDFCQRNADWLDDFALFMALSDASPGKVWTEWEAPLARHDASALAAAAALHAERIAFWKFCQWCFDTQWHRLRAYAAAHGVKIIGDAPIFIAHHSAEVWSRRDLFLLEANGLPSVVAGVPPDFFSATGQRWGNPLYRWPAHAAEGYAWWIQRLRRVFDLVDLVRIDHFRGFAAHWEIPATEATAVHGHWALGPGAPLFDAIAQALGPLPIIAEDLGVITPDVEALRKACGYPGMRILHFAFGDDATNRYLPHHHEADTVVYAGTHDNDTSAGWWGAVSAHERAHVLEYFDRGATATQAAADPSGEDVAWWLIRASCASVADTALHTLQDVLGLPSEYRMNKPGEGDGWWTWRFEWTQLQPWHAERLAALARLYGRGVAPA